jgi:hypothetical protein
MLKSVPFKIQKKNGQLMGTLYARCHTRKASNPHPRDGMQDASFLHKSWQLVPGVLLCFQNELKFMKNLGSQ